MHVLQWEIQWHSRQTFRLIHFLIQNLGIKKIHENLFRYTLSQWHVKSLPSGGEEKTEIKTGGLRYTTYKTTRVPAKPFHHQFLPTQWHRDFVFPFLCERKIKSVIKLLSTVDQGPFWNLSECQAKTTVPGKWCLWNLKLIIAIRMHPCIFSKPEVFQVYEEM